MSLLRKDLDRELLHKGVGALVRDRPACPDCGRTPLTGEVVHVYEHGDAVCALCRPGRGEEPLRTERVRHFEHGNAVRATARAA
jgi:transcription initiation factor TFIIIB Brf1 subunit/transcription initiation factor TFIIB